MERIYFPQNVYKLTQGYGLTSSSHKGTKALDINGDFDIFAPFTGTIKRLYIPKDLKKQATTCWLVSNEKVLFADGSIDYAVFMAGHPKEIVNFKIGQEFKQNEFMMTIGDTGSSTGKHLHFEIAKGKKTSWYKNKDGKIGLTNAIAPQDYMFMKDNCKVVNEKYKLKKYHFKKEKEMLKTINANGGLWLHKTPNPKYTKETRKLVMKNGSVVTYFRTVNKTAYVQTKNCIFGYCSPKYLKGN